jgi:hypothetical protein
MAMERGSSGEGSSTLVAAKDKNSMGSEADMIREDLQKMNAVPVHMNEE